ncbi:hypothetical protein, partial [Streptomyces sp. NPDC096934]|uniref:hypothetical protein n=1 Tax=Streptomyces sp. NPDC096934 TaxID=3155551 RepID=UPI003327EA49
SRVTVPSSGAVSPAPDAPAGRAPLPAAAVPDLPVRRRQAENLGGVVNGDVISCSVYEQLVECLGSNLLESSLSNLVAAHHFLGARFDRLPHYDRQQFEEVGSRSEIKVSAFGDECIPQRA